jgi:hypothetical protein
MKKKMFLITLLTVAAFAVHAQDAQALVQASRDRIKADTVSSRSRMVIRAKDGAT